MGTRAGDGVLHLEEDGRSVRRRQRGTETSTPQIQTDLRRFSFSYNTRGSQREASSPSCSPRSYFFFFAAFFLAFFFFAIVQSPVKE
jgi:hypothetical protein